MTEDKETMTTDMAFLGRTQTEPIPCEGCGLALTKTTTDWEMYRYGYFLHDALPCYRARCDRALASGWRMPKHRDPLF